MVGRLDADAVVLPPIREEVHCLAGPVQYDGSPSWTLQDPASSRFFRIGWLQFEILSRWSLANPQRIAAAVTQDTTLHITVSDVEAVYQFLLSNNLLIVRGQQATQRLWSQVKASRKSLLMQLVHHYLFFKIPLFKPDPLLAWLYPRVSWIYSRWFALLTVLVGILGVYLVSRQWEAFLNTFMYMFSWQGLSQFFLVLCLSKVLHEFGHALTAHRYGCRVPTMGVAFMVMYPMLYTDANETWKLNSRRQRLAIASAGMISELYLAAFATFLWNFMDDGALRSGVFLLASSIWIITLVINLNPLMRFDGYYLLSDWLKIENFQPRAFEYSKWHLRRWLFLTDTQPPESVPQNLATIFIIYAWCIWIYRFFLFLGIAWMVYHLFFKLLGIMLMVVEIGWFILGPIWREVRQWPTALKTGRHAWRLASILGLIVMVCLIPWQQHIEVPALIKPAQYTEIYLPYAARLDDWNLQPGQAITVGDALVTLSSNELTYKKYSAELESQSLSWQVAFQGFDPEKLKHRQLNLSQLETATSKMAGYSKQLNQLRIQSDLAGKVLDINPDIQSGQLLKVGEKLMTVGNDSAYIVEAYVSEKYIKQIVPQQIAMFYPDNTYLSPLKCLLQHIDDGSSTSLPNLLVSTYGGQIAARVDKQKSNIAEEAHYRIQLTVDEQWQRPVISPIIQRGTVKTQTQRISIISQAWQLFLSLVFRESGF